MEKNIEVDLMLIGKRIRKARREQGLTLEQAAGLADFSQQHLSIVERGVKRGSIITYVKIAAVLGLSLDDLFNADATVPYSEKDGRWEDLMSDCSAFEKTIINEMLFALKAVLLRVRKQ